MVRVPVTTRLAARQDSEDAGPSDVPPAGSFLRRAFARAAVLGSYLYIDGGEVSQLVNGQVDGERPANGVNDTLSVDLSSSWSPESVAFETITKPAPVTDLESLWVDTFDRSFYLWGGQGSDQIPPEQNVLWKFTSDGQGRGGWTEILPSNLGVFNALTRVWNGASTSAEPGKRSGFTMGGTATNMTQPGLQLESGQQQPVPGIVTYNITNGAFSNDTAAAFTSSGTWMGGNAEFVPGFGVDGVIALLGGLTLGARPFESPDDAGSSAYIDFQNITFYDPLSREWYWQTTSGPVPPDRRNACTVGISGQEGERKTYEIFLFGGTNNVQNQTFDDVFVLSLPGFVWHQLESANAPRSHHACVVAGQRQMISVGGYQDHYPYPNAWTDPDPFPQGLGIFDLSDSVWKREFDAKAAAYEAPRAVQEWYNNGGQDSVPWSSDTVKKLFIEGGKGFDAAGESSKTGVILGTVIGAMAFIIIALVGIALYLRRRDRPIPFPSRWPPNFMSSFKPVRTGSDGGQQQQRQEERFELADTSVGIELDSNPVHHELYSPQQQRAGWRPVRESWYSATTMDTGTGMGTTTGTNTLLSPISPPRPDYRDG